MDSALVLAGGHATRLGRPKALEEIGGRPCVRRVVDAVAPLAAETIVSVGDAGMAEALRPTLSAVTFVTDRRPGTGPLEGIRRGAEVARGERLLVAPCDAPFLRTALYRLLLEALGGHEAAVPRIDVVDPVRAVYERAAVLRALKEYEKSIASPSALVDRLDAIFIGPERLRSIDPTLDSFLDVNTEADLAEAVRRIRSAVG